MKDKFCRKVLDLVLASLKKLLR